MAHCTKCGAAVADNAGFCAACGAPQAGAAAGAAPIAAQVPSQMAENVAGLVCYIVGWITGLIMYFVDKRPYVRYHAAQSIVVFGGLHILLFIVGAFFGMSMMAGGFAAFGFGAILYWLVLIVSFVLWIVLMIKAYQGVKFRVPIAADLAEKLFGKY